MPTDEVVYWKRWSKTYVVCLQETGRCPNRPLVLQDFTVIQRHQGMTTTTTIIIIIIMIIIINLIYIAQFDTNGILTALYIVITYIQMQYVHV